MKRQVLIRSFVLGLISFFCSNLSAQLIEIPNTFVGPPSCSYALSFDGETNFLPLDNGVVPTNQVTIATWVKPESTSNGTILHWGPTSGCNPSAQFFLIRNGRLELGTGCGTAIRGGTTLTTDTWYHVAVTINSAGITTLYVNGVQDGTGNGRTGNGANVGTGVNTIGVGAGSGIRVNYYEGAMSELSIWNRVLTPSELTNLMSNPIEGDESKLIKYYPFNEGEGNTISDQTIKKSFNGDSSYVAIPTIVPASGFSVVLDVTPSTNLANGALYYHGPRTGCNPSAQSLMLVNGKVRANTGCGGGMDIISAATLAAGVKYTIAFTVSSSGFSSIYVNGVLETTGNTRNGNTVSGGNVEIGRIFSSNTPSRYFDGMVEEVSIWNKELTSVEVTNVKANGLNGSETNLMGLYDLSKVENGTVNDASENQNDATAFNLVPAPNKTVELGGKFNNFNGLTTITPVNGQASVTDYSYLFTFKPVDVTQGTFFYYGPRSGCNPSGQSLILNNGKVRFITGCGGNAFIESNTTLVAGQEYHIALLMNSAGIASLYIDGVLEGSGDTRRGNSVSVGNNIIGARYSSNALTGYLSGTLSEVSIWNVTLSSSGVSSFINNGVTGNEQGLRAWYTLEDYTGGNTVLDSSPNGNDANARNLSTIDLTSASLWSVTNSNLDVNVTVSGNEISADLSNAESYQWLDCGNGNALLSGETSNSFTASQTGDYSVEITEGACVDTSACEMVVVTSVEDKLLQENQLTVYPNPATEFIYTGAGFVQIYNQLGSLILSKNSNGKLDVSSLETGVYLLMIDNKRTKLVIE